MSKKTTVTSTVVAANLPTEFHCAYVFLNNGAARVDEVKTMRGYTWITFTVKGEQKTARVPDTTPLTFTSYVEDWPGEPDFAEV